MAIGQYDNSVTQRVTGTVHVDNFASIIPVTGTVNVVPTKSFTPSMATFLASTTASLFSAKNINRKQLWVHTSGSSYLFLGLGTVSTSSYFMKIEPGALWELPSYNNVYVGEVWGVWSGPSGTAHVTEVR